MRFHQNKPCKTCPFLKTSAPGYLGDSTPVEFVDTTLSDALMPCHNTVKYERPDWKLEMMQQSSHVQHCAGARIFYKNQCKISKHPIYLAMVKFGRITPVQASDSVFANRAGFLAHHEGVLK